MNMKTYEKHYENVMEKLLEEAFVPDSERAATMLAQLEADIAGNSGRSQGNATVKVGRNDPCPCGSGKKYKRCCGR